MIPWSNTLSYEWKQETADWLVVLPECQALWTVHPYVSKGFGNTRVSLEIGHSCLPTAYVHITCSYTPFNKIPRFREAELL